MANVGAPNAFSTEHTIVGTRCRRKL